MAKKRQISRWVSINQKKDFILLKKQGQKKRKKNFFVVYRKNKLSLTRVAFVFPKWTGNAVKRNRFKRWARSFLRHRPDLSGLDLLLGFEKKEKDLYKNMNYEKFCFNFSALLPKKKKDS